jgi:hypothetical protein
MLVFDLRLSGYKIDFAEFQRGITAPFGTEMVCLDSVSNARYGDSVCT